MSLIKVKREFQPGPIIEVLLRGGLGAPSASVRNGSVDFPAGVDWTPLCAVAHRCRIAPVVYQCLRRSSLAVPNGVMDWFRAQYYDTVARNLGLLSDLRVLLGWFTEAEIPVIVLKGPALAELSLGMARISRDLDVLIHSGDLRQVDAMLRRHGCAVVPGPPHDYHRRYQSPMVSGGTVVEVHFDISDRPRSHRPDITGIWERSCLTAISEIPMRVPELLDHLLLTIMQLPHHHWAMRLVVDVWQIALRWRSEVDWPILMERAAAWQMRVLARSTVHALGTMFGVAIAPEAMSMSDPSGYLERVQWQIMKSAIAEQLEYPFRPRVTLVAPFVMVDQPRELPAIMIKRLLGAGGAPEESSAAKATRRNVTAVAALPAIGRVLLASIGQASRRSDPRGQT